MNRLNKRLVGTGVLALVLPFSACGNGEDDKAAASISAQIQKDNESGLSVTTDEADCIGDGFVSKIGTEKLQEYKLIDSDLEATDEGDVTMSKDDADEAATVFEDCADIKGLMSKAMEGEGMPDGAKECVDEELTDERLHDFLVGLFSGDQSASEEFGQAIQECVAAS